MKILSRVHESFDVDIPMQRLFREPTIAAMAEHIDSTRRGGDASGMITPVSRVGRLPLSFVQQPRRGIDSC